MARSHNYEQRMTLQMLFDIVEIDLIQPRRYPPRVNGPVLQISPAVAPVRAGTVNCRPLCRTSLTLAGVRDDAVVCLSCY